MADIVTFDPVNLRIVEIDSGNPINSLTVQEVYSEWKDWLLADASRLAHAQAFRQVGGDPIGGGNSLAPYTFLNTTAGWRIRPAEADHELRLAGNLYSEDPSLGMFAATLGSYTATVVVERSASAISVTVGGIDQATVQAAMTAQGYTTARAPKIDSLDAAISSLIGAGLTSTQANQILALYQLAGLDPTKPLVVSTSARKVPANGSAIDQTIVDVNGTVTVTRQ